MRRVRIMRRAAALLALCAAACALAAETAPRPALTLRGPRLETDSDVARWVAGTLHARLGLSAADRLVVMRPARRWNGRAVFKIAQTAAGLPVVGAESRLILDAAGRPAALLGGHAPFPSPPAAAPTLDRPQAAARLAYWPDGGKLRLAYEVAGAAERVYIDAHGGGVLQRLPSAWGALARGVYDVAAACREAQVSGLLRPRRLRAVLRAAERNYARTEASPRPSGADAERLFAMLGEYYRFLRDTLALDSFDNRGSPLRAFGNVRFHEAAPGQPQCVGGVFNAFWNDSAHAAFIPAAALDYSEVVGHELGHGVIGAGSGLIYQGQPGALHEALADAFGVAFRAWLENGGAGVPERIAADGWRIRSPGGASRDLRAPGSLAIPGTAVRYPDHFDDFRHMRRKDDNGGVHVNSSIVNQAFYLLAMGGRHPRQRSGPVVPGIGLRKAIGIFGLAASDLLTRNAGFEAARYAFALAAEIRYGKSSPEWIAVHRAMDAAGIPGYWTRPAPQPAPTLQTKPPPAPTPTPLPPAQPPTTTTTGTPPPPLQTPPPMTKPQTTEQPPPAPTSTSPPPAPAPPTTEPPADDPSGVTPWPLVWVALFFVLLAFCGYKIVMFVTDERPLEQAAAPPPPPAPIRTAGALIPPDGGAPIALRRGLLASAEGMVIGRSAALCHVQIRDPRVSRRHLRLRLSDGALQVEDLNSTRGTRVDADPAPPFQAVPLRSGRTLHIASLPYRFAASSTGSRRSRGNAVR